MRFRFIWFLFLLVGAGWLANHYLLQPRLQEMEAHPRLLRIDTARITAIAIRHPDGSQTLFSAENDGWLASDGNHSSWVDPTQLREFMRSLQQLETGQLIAADKDSWANYGVDSTRSTQIQLFDQQLVLENFHLGKLNFDQKEGQAFLRFDGQKEVYAVDAFSTVPLLQPYGTYRQHNFLELPAVIPDSMVLVQDSSVLQLQPATLDSAFLTDWHQRLRSSAPATFAERFDEFSKAIYSRHQLRLYYAGDSVRVNAFADSSHQKDFILQSEQYPANFYYSDSSGLFSLLFLELQKNRPTR